MCFWLCQVFVLCSWAARLWQAHVAVNFVTNTTDESKRNLLEQLQQLNFNRQVKYQKAIFGQ